MNKNFELKRKYNIIHNINTYRCFYYYHSHSRYYHYRYPYDIKPTSHPYSPHYLIKINSKYRLLYITQLPTSH